MAETQVVNVIIAGLGGQGVITASDVLADAAFRAGFDVRKAEVHGMSQRGGSVASDVRYGKDVLSPMIPRGEADALVVLQEDQVDTQRGALREGGTLITPAAIDADALPNKKQLNVALLGRLSAVLALPEEAWRTALAAAFPPSFFEGNWAAFQLGRKAAAQ